MKQRYDRAARLTAPRAVLEVPGVALEGYWLDQSSFYFLAERIEPSLGRTVDIPSLADCKARTVEELISLDRLATLLSQTLEHPVRLDALAGADFDMPARDRLAVSVEGHHYLIDLRQQRVVESTRSLEVPALYSPDGRHACFVKSYDLWLSERDTGAVRPLTSDGAALRSYGQKSGMSLRAISYRKRPVPVGLWSPGSQWFLTRRVDETAVPDTPIVQHAPPDGSRPMLHTFKCALLGDPLPVATYVAVHIPTGRVVTFEDFPALDVMAYAPLSQLAWFAGDEAAWFVRFDRYFQRADLIRLDLPEGRGRIVLSESAPSGYLTLQSRAVGTQNVRTLQSGEVIWFSERDGWGHLYLHDGASGAVKHQITSGHWRVRDIVHVDEQQRRVFFLASGMDPAADPAQRCLCVANLDGSGFEVLSAADGDIYVSVTPPAGLDQDRPYRPARAQPGISPDARFGVVRCGSVERGNLLSIVDLRSRSRSRSRSSFPISSVRPGENERAPSRFTALAADGATRLHGVMHFPSDFDASKRYALIDCIYPGPQIAHQPQTFRAVHSALAASLAELSFITIMCDTRGMPIGSRALHQIGYGGTLEPQLADHAAVIRQLCAECAFLDRERIGMIGSSGGGAATARALFDYGELFKVGVAVCGNHDSSLYSTIWSDKYRGPGTRQSFAEQANTSVAHKLQGKLLLISGDMDENVHLAQTLSLADALIRANRDFELLIVPNEGHYVLENNGYVQRRIWDYFVRHLLGREPPHEFELRFESHELSRAEKRMWREAVQR